MEALNERRGDGWGVVAYYKDAWEQTENHLLTAWKMWESVSFYDFLIWDYIKTRKQPLWIQVESGELGIFSILTKHTVAESTYTTKKGITRTKKAYEETIHRTVHGEYLGTDALLGSKPISYPIRIPVSPTYCKLVELGDTLADCFELDMLKEIDRSTITHKDVPRTERKNMRRVVRSNKAKTKATPAVKPQEPKEPAVKPKPRFKIQIAKEEDEDEDNEEEDEEADDEDDE